MKQENDTLTAMSEFDPVEWPIGGVLDLHLFRPAEVKDLAPDYLVVTA